MNALKGLILTSVFAWASTSAASEKVFFGRWEPPASLQTFWAPIQESWWNPDDLSKFRAYDKAFAGRSDPHDLMGDILTDLKKHPSVERTFVYSMLIVQWNPAVTLKLLRPYAEARDMDLRKIADDFIADIEEYQALSNHEKQRGREGSGKMKAGDR
jgi:hypothetical protein